MRATRVRAQTDRTDVENLLFNNIEQTLAMFSRTGRTGVRFEDRGLVAPLAPDGTVRQSYYSYRLAEADEPFAAVDAGRLVCRVPETTVPAGPARLAARIWLAVRRARPEECSEAPLASGAYLLRIAALGLDPGTTVKAVVDGASAAMQRDEPDRVGPAIARLSALLDVNEEELLALATAPGAPLGARSRSKPTSKECLFTLDGTTQVRVTPDDDRCIAAAVLAGDAEPTPARLMVEVYSASRR